MAKSFEADKRKKNKEIPEEKIETNIPERSPISESTPLLATKETNKATGNENRKFVIGVSEVATPFEVLGAGVGALGISLVLGTKEITKLSDYLDKMNNAKIFAEGALGTATFGAVAFLFFLGEAYHKWLKDDAINDKSIVAFFNNEKYGQEVLKKTGRTVVGGGVIFESFLFLSPLVIYGMEALGELLKAATIGQVALNATGTLVLATALTGIFNGIVKKLGGDPSWEKLLQIAISLEGFGMGGTVVKAIISAENLNEYAAKIVTTVGIPLVAATPTVIPLVPSAVSSAWKTFRKGFNYGFDSFFMSDKNQKIINQDPEEGKVVDTSSSTSGMTK